MVADHLFGTTRAKILSALLGSAEPVTVKAMAQATGLSSSTVRTELQCLVALDLAVAEHGECAAYLPNDGHEVVQGLARLLRACAQAA